MIHRWTPLATLLALVAMTALSACGGGSESDASAVDPNPPTAARKSAHTLEELQSQGQRARQHHTVYVELKHPGSSEAEKSRRSVPYHFDHPTRQTVCMDPDILHGHSVEIHPTGSAGPALAVISAANPCQDVQFDAGDYEAVIQHSGTGATDEVTHVFAHAGFVPTGHESVLGRWLMQNNAAQAAAGRGSAGRVQKLAADAPTCTRIETIALQYKNADTYNSYFSTVQPVNNMALFELRKTAQTALTIVNYARTVSDSNLMTVYACGSNFKFQAVSNGMYLKSQCGYPLFSASTIDDASEYIPYWDPDHLRLDLVNAQTRGLLKGVQRAGGLLVDPATHKSYPTQTSVGTCTNYPDNLQTGGELFDWVPVTIDKAPANVLFDYSNPSIAMVAEFAHHDLGPLNIYRQRRDISQKGDTDGIPINAYQRQYRRFDVGSGNLTEFGYPLDVELTGGFVPNHQEVLVFSFGNCQKCDLTGMDFSNRTMAALDLRGATLTNASFVNAHVLSARFDNAVISGTDFTGARFQSVSFEGAQISASPGTGVKTTFDGTILASASFPSNFQRATISDAVFKNLDLTGATWADATVSDSSFDAVTFDGVDLSHSTLTGNTHTGGSFVGASFDNSSLSGITLVVARARSSSFKGAVLTGFRASNGDFSNANFHGATIIGSTFNYAYAVGADFSSTTWTNSSFDYAQAYSDGTAVTRFDGCTVVSGNFSNSLFMQSSFDNCRFQGGGFSGSSFVAASFQGVTSSSDSTNSQLSFEQALLAGASFSSATFNAGDLTNSIISTRSGSVDITIRTSPYLSETSPGESLTRTYHYDATTRPATTGAQTTCPNSMPGPCTTDASWKAVNPPAYKGHEDPDSW